MFRRVHRNVGARWYGSSVGFLGNNDVERKSACKAGRKKCNSGLRIKVNMMAMALDTLRQTLDASALPFSCVISSRQVPGGHGKLKRGGQSLKTNDLTRFFY